MKTQEINGIVTHFYLPSDQMPITGDRMRLVWNDSPCMQELFPEGYRQHGCVAVMERQFKDETHAEWLGKLLKCSTIATGLGDHELAAEFMDVYFVELERCS